MIYRVVDHTNIPLVSIVDNSQTIKIPSGGGGGRLTSEVALQNVGSWYRNDEKDVSIGLEIDALLITELTNTGNTRSGIYEIEVDMFSSSQFITSTSLQPSWNNSSFLNNI